MGKNIEIEITYNDNEIRKAISFYIIHICDTRTYAFIAYPMIFAAILLSLIFGGYPLLALVFLLCGFILYYVYYQKPIEGYLKFYRKRKGGIYRFENDKVHIIGTEVQSECAWSVFKKAYEIPSAFLLIDDNKFVYIFPKVCFNSTPMIEQLSDLLAIKISGFKKYK